MRSLSIPYIAWLPPVLAGVAIAMLWSAEPGPPRYDLRASASIDATSEGTIAVRAWVFDVEAYAIPRVVDTQILWTLSIAGGDTVQSGALARSNVEGREGTLPVFGAVGQTHVLTLRARVNNKSLVLERRIPIVEEATVAEKLSQTDGGPTRPHQGLALGAVGGGCVPEMPCTLLLSIRHPTRAINITPLGGARWAARDGSVLPRVVPPGRRFLRLASVVRGNHGALRIAETGSDAATELPIPIISGGLRVVRVSEEGDFVRINVDAIDGLLPLAVDVFAKGAWVGAGSLPAKEPRVSAKLLRAKGTPRNPRIQVRRGVFSKRPVGVAFVTEEALSEEEELTNALAAQYALLVPPSTGSKTAEIAQRDAGQRRRSVWTGVFIAVLGLLTGGVLYRMERASREVARGVSARASRFGAPMTTGGARVHRLWVATLLVFVVVAWIALRRAWP